jgi:hypothetical protein
VTEGHGARCYGQKEIVQVFNWFNNVSFIMNHSFIVYFVCK